MSTRPFPYRVLVVDDDPLLRELGSALLENQGYEVRCAEDGFEGLAALKQSLPDIIISDLRMPNMSGFEFLSVVRRRFPLIPVIVISGEFIGLAVPDSVLADAFFPKAGYKMTELFSKMEDLLHELPARPRTESHGNAAVWVRNGKGRIAVTCPECLRTFPLESAITGVNIAECDFCSSKVRFEIIDNVHRFVSVAKPEI
ncbi:response regulator [Terriglobus albidus]|uniref:Response regulator n=1 Tax=Terriglobus albidus TaxID=1592106 RepID=A0A5B9E6S1_9BACT|nr:response regulator [Terriglobus albidus]QEE27972.1 response regulator [Terriglobus albidus]